MNEKELLGKVKEIVEEQEFDNYLTIVGYNTVYTNGKATRNWQGQPDQKGLSNPKRKMVAILVEIDDKIEEGD